MGIITIGIDPAKNVFAVHGVDETVKPVLVRPAVKRAALVELIAKLPPCLVGMEACSGAHHWAREFARYGHTARLMASKFVTPYRLSGKKGKNDAADAQAICEAVSRPNMRFVPVDASLQDPIFFRSDWRFGVADSMSARTTTESTTDAGYTTAGASPKAKLSISLMPLRGSPYTPG